MVRFPWFARAVLLEERLHDVLDLPHRQRHEQDPESLVCARDRLRYEVRDGIPILLIDEAKPLGAAAAPA